MTDDTNTNVSITSVFPSGIDFGGVTYTSLYVGSNGYITFGTGYSSFTPEGIAGFNNNYPIIAGQFDDLDPSKGGSIYYYQNTAGNYVVASYESVAPFSAPYNGSGGTSFQIVLRKPADYSSTNRVFQIEVRYQNIGWWQSGNVSSPPSAGWSTGNQTSYAEMPYSGSSSFNLNQSNSNIGEAGVYRWDVTAGVVLAVPTVNQTTSITSITSAGANSGGNVSSDGGASVTARGVVWSTSQTPTISSNLGFTSNGSGTGSFSSTLSGLSPSTTYYVRAYATNSQGTGYGPQQSFTTSAGCSAATPPPSASVSSVTASSASLSWAASSGTATITYYWSVRRVSDNGVAASGNTTGTSASTSALSAGTTYYLQVYANNCGGNSGTRNSSNFTTWTTPTVTTTPTPGSLTATSATLSGEVTATGGTTVTARGIALGTSSNPSSGTASGSGTGTFNANVTGLSPNTLYYFRAYATNSVGTSYGTQHSFTTPKADQTGVSGTLTASSIQYGLTTTVSASGGQSSGAYEFQRTGGTDCVSFSGSGSSRTITGTAVGSTTIQVRRLGDDTYNDSVWVSVGTLTVTKAPLTVTADDKSKVYGDSDPVLTYTPSGTLYFSDAFTVITGVSLSAPTGAAATASGSPHTITISGGTATNYAITHVNGTLTVTQRPLTGSFTVASPKVYDDTTAATVATRSLSNLASGDTQDANGVQLTGGTANFDTNTVGTDKTVTLTGMSLAGAKAANYVLQTMNTTTADIIPGPPSMANREPQLQEQGTPLPDPKKVTNPVAGQTLAPIKVQLYDAFGNPVGAGHEVTVSVNKNSFADGSTLTATTDADGYATFDNLKLTTADEDYRLTFSVTVLN